MMYSEVDSQHDSPKDWGYFTGEFILKSLRKTCVFFELHVLDVISVVVLQPLTIMELDERIRSQSTDFPPSTFLRTSIRNHTEVVGGWPNPVKNMKVSWDDYSQYMEKMFQTTNQWSINSLFHKYAFESLLLSCTNQRFDFAMQPITVHRNSCLHSFTLPTFLPGLSHVPCAIYCHLINHGYVNKSLFSCVNQIPKTSTRCDFQTKYAPKIPNVFKAPIFPQFSTRLFRFWRLVHQQLSEAPLDGGQGDGRVRQGKSHISQHRGVLRRFHREK